MTAPGNSVSNDINHYSAVATADMSGKADRFVKFFQSPPTGALDRLAFALCDADDEPDGVLNDGPDAGMPGDVNTIGRLRIELGATVAAFAEVGPDSVGRGVTYGEGRGYMKVLKGGAVNEVVDGVWLGRRRNSAKIESNDLGDTFDVDADLHKITIGAGADTATLPNGRYTGQKKYLRVVTDGGGSYAITGAFKTGTSAQTTATFDTVDEFLFVEWDGTAWFVLNNSGATMA